MITKADLRNEAARFSSFFEAAGAVPMEADILQPADALLDLYGEDIRARAYVTSDPLRGEQMLRPDFTVPVVQRHMKDGAEPARYTYAGEVFRRQEEDPDRANEYLQVGYEIFERDDPAAADAEVFALFAEALTPLKLRATTGDIGILMAAVKGLTTTDRRKAALLRHIWRPRRFRALLDRFGGRSDIAPTRVKMLEMLKENTVESLLESTGPMIGKRSAAEVAARLNTLKQDADVAPISASEVEMLEAILSLRETAPNAMEALRDIAVDMPAITPALQQVDKRLACLDARGIDVSGLEFDASHGRSSMEYYDGFVFAFVADSRPDLPPVATGGRYDALTRVLGQGKSIPAVGGVIRPELTLALGVSS